MRQYTNQHEKWRKFESTLAEQNLLEMQPLGQRNAPLCDGCLKLKEHAVEYVTSTFANTDVRFSGYLETIFSGGASHYCKVNYTEDFITGFLYKKDKIHDHIPIPEPTRVSSFIQFPVPMPFHALTFTVTYVGLCLKCDKLWYCDTLSSANWTNRMKWVIPTSARKWYSFGITEGPGSGAHGIQFSTKGYKNFIVLCDTWGRQEQWMRAIDEAILGLASHSAKRIDPANAMAIEIDNEVDTDEFDLSYMRAAAATGGDSADKNNGAAQHAIKSEGGRNRSNKHEEDASIRRRSNTISTSLSEIERLHQQFQPDSHSPDDKSSRARFTTSEQHTLNPGGGKIIPGTRAAKDTNLQGRKGDPLARSPASSTPPKHDGGSASSTAQQRKLDLKKFQPDTRKFSEILYNLKMASPPRVNADGAVLSTGRQIPPTPPASSAPKLPTMLPTKQSVPQMILSSLTETLATGDASVDDNVRPKERKKSGFVGIAFSPANAAAQLASIDRNPLEPLGMRHVVSTPNLSQLS